MDGRSFLGVARELAIGTTEAHWRTAAGRAYYALMLAGRDCLQRWGFSPPARDRLHAFVGLRFSFAADADLKQIGVALDYLSQLRNRADYEPHSPSFTSNLRAQRAITDASRALSILDAVDGDPARRAAAIASIRAAWP